MDSESLALACFVASYAEVDALDLAEEMDSYTRSAPRLARVWTEDFVLSTASVTARRVLI